MHDTSFGDGITGSTGAGLRLGRSRSANEELARILGGIGELPDSLPRADRAEADYPSRSDPSDGSPPYRASGQSQAGE